MPLLPATERPAYRPDIDGLRAVAILGVLLYHARLGRVSGGFVGVDVFFVISGFLITRLIHGEMAGGHFRLGAFYQRRVRRIFPALLVMLAAATGVAAWLFFAGDFERFARTLAATALFGTNIELWREAGYFDAAARSKPLLHLWSIAVEEQFYLLFPLLLLAMRRSPRRMQLFALAILGAASFAWSAWGVRHAPVATFYLLPSRVWELMLGAVLAIGGWKAASVPMREMSGALGLGLILASAWFLTTATPFPGPAALPACLGAALVIFAAGGWAGRLLSSRPLVFLGLVSYSLYLWHWPLLVFSRYALYRDLTTPERLGLVALALVLAILSWRFVERPWRRLSLRPVVLFPLAGAAMASFAGLAIGVIALKGLPERMSKPIRTILAERHDDDGLLQYCFSLPLNKLDAQGLCRFGVSRAAKPSFILWGDSHADAILLAVEDVAKQVGREGYFAGESSCAPLMGVFRPDAPRCRDFNDRVLAFVKSQPDIDTVVLMARWGKNAAGTATADEGDGFVPVADKEGAARQPADNAAIFTRGLIRTVDALQAAHKKVVLVGPVPEIGMPVPQTLARLALSGDDREIGPSLARYLRREKTVLPLFRRLARRPGVSAVYPGRFLCRSGRCKVRKDGIPLYRDSHHLSVFGARLLNPLLAGIFSPEPAGAPSGAG